MQDTIQQLPIRPSIAESMLLCSDFDQTSDRLLRPISQIMESPSGVILRFKKNLFGDYPIEASTFVLPRKTIGVYTEHFFEKDPIALEAFGEMRQESSEPSRSIVPLFDLVDRQNFAKSEYYNEFLLANDLEDVLAMFITVDDLPDEIFCLAVQRWRGMPNFNSSDIATFRALRPTMSLCLSNIALREAVQSLRSMNAQLEGGTIMGMTSWDEHLRLIYSAGSTLIDLQLEEDYHRNEWIGWLRELVTARSESGVIYDGQYAHLHLWIEASIVQGRRRYTVISSTPSSNIAIKKWVESRNLTSREAEVCAYILSGLSNENISVYMGISQKTVQNHIISIFSKFCVNSRTQLTARIMGWEKLR